jgi:hypothetical protein
MRSRVKRLPRLWCALLGLLPLEARKRQRAEAAGEWTTENVRGEAFAEKGGSVDEADPAEATKTR